MNDGSRIAIPSPTAAQPSMQSVSTVCRTGRLSRRLVIKSSIAVCFWSGANLAAIQCIEAYEFSKECQRHQVSPYLARSFDAKALHQNAGKYLPRDKTSYRLLSPKHLQDGKQYPVVLYLHGAGERGNDNVQQLRSVPSWLATDENRQRFPCYLIVPQCPRNSYWNYRGTASPPPADELGIVHSILCSILRLPSADVNRVYIVGYSMGGYGTWEFACRHPELVAAIIPVAGAGDPDRADNLRNMSIWAVHGSDDHVVPVAGSDAMINAIQAAGGRPMYSRIAGIGHGALAPALQKTDRILSWLFEQSK